ncbi:piggyBac transposable element-derived protein 4 isoform X1 [Vespula maculifrons]|uniref:PiggyBac transposable element-derived protein 4 isoform X1 n=1 Tax=Vespula maculifrons TaxID=7453 RepID=A0ABD2B9F3_VESMC
MSLTMFSTIIENVEIAGNTKAMKQSQFEINHLQRTQSTGIVYEVELVAKWTVISMNSRETLHREINNELSNKNTANFTLQYVYNEKSPESTNTRCGTEKVLLAIKQFSIEYRPNIESNGLIINKKSTVLPVTSELLIDVSLKSNAQLQEVMNRDRFLCLKILHFNINKVTIDSDKLYKIWEICNMLRQRFQKVFYPFENLCIDEILQAAKKLHKNHTLYVDNWYTSPAVFILLHKNGTNACETCDKRQVYILSTFHNEVFVDPRRHYRIQEMIKKSKCVVDMVISNVHSQHKNMKWYKKYKYTFETLIAYIN